MTDGKWMIIEAGGKQHFVTAGSRVTANRVELEVGTSQPAVNLLDGSPVTLTVIEHTFGPKINGIKFKNKVRYLKRYGHRQPQTVFEVNTKEQPKTKPIATPKSAAKVKSVPKAKKASK